MARSRTPELTVELISSVHATFAPAPALAADLLDEAGLETGHRAMLGGLDPDADIWLFGYGSLLWYPDIAFAERRPGRAFGWHRRFCLRQSRVAGSEDEPGLVLALDRGGSCQGAVFRIPGPDAAGRLRGTWRREMIGRGYHAVWMPVVTAAGPVTALGFVANRASPRYTGRRPDAEVAAEIARGRGPKVLSATYLFETWRHCREQGIRDPMLERLARLVAVELHRLAGSGPQMASVERQSRDDNPTPDR